MRGSFSGSLWYIALQKFKKNFWGVLSLSYIVLVALLALFAYVLAPDASTNANQMELSLRTKAPGFSVDMLTLDASKAKSSFFKTFLYGKKAVSTIPIASHKLIKDTLVVVPYAVKHVGEVKKIPLDRFKSNNGYSDYLQKRTFWLGTDTYGRDLLSRILVGSRISFTIGFVAVGISLILGVFLGALAGYYKGWVDACISWLIHVMWSIPTLLLVIAITLTLGKGVWQVFLAVGLTMWVEVARVVRGQVLGISKAQYITAAKGFGFSDFRILFRHILPNCIGPIIVIAAANFAAAILIESGLSFLGIGAQPPVPSWGAIIKEHYNYLVLGKPFLALVPGIAIVSLVLAFMLMGNALRDALDVKQ